MEATTYKLLQQLAYARCRAWSTALVAAQLHTLVKVAISLQGIEGQILQRDEEPAVYDVGVVHELELRRFRGHLSMSQRFEPFHTHSMSLHFAIAVEAREGTS